MVVSSNAAYLIVEAFKILADRRVEEGRVSLGSFLGGGESKSNGLHHHEAAAENALHCRGRHLSRVLRIGTGPGRRHLAGLVIDNDHHDYWIFCTFL